MARFGAEIDGDCPTAGDRWCRLSDFSSTTILSAPAAASKSDATGAARLVETVPPLAAQEGGAGTFASCCCDATGAARRVEVGRAAAGSTGGRSRHDRRLLLLLLHPTLGPLLLEFRARLRALRLTFATLLFARRRSGLASTVDSHTLLLHILLQWWNIFGQLDATHRHGFATDARPAHIRMQRPGGVDNSTII